MMSNNIKIGEELISYVNYNYLFYLEEYKSDSYTRELNSEDENSKYVSIIGLTVTNPNTGSLIRGNGGLPITWSDSKSLVLVVAKPIAKCLDINKNNIIRYLDEKFSLLYSL